MANKTTRWPTPSTSCQPSSNSLASQTSMRHPPEEDIDELPRPGPQVLHDNDSPMINSESLRRIQGRPLPTATDSPPRLAAFSEYGTGGTALTDQALQELMDQGHEGRGLLMETLWIREAEGRRRMVRTKDWKFVTDPGSDDLDELYDLNADPWELTNMSSTIRQTSLSYRKCEPY